MDDTTAPPVQEINLTLHPDTGLITIGPNVSQAVTDAAIGMLQAVGLDYSFEGTQTLMCDTPDCDGFVRIETGTTDVDQASTFSRQHAATLGWTHVADPVSDHCPNHPAYPATGLTRTHKD